MSKKRTTWVLDTETKGTGAEMVPLERIEERKRLKGDPAERLRVIAPGKRDESQAAVEPQTPPAPRRFRVENLLSRQVLAEDVGISDALQALRGLDRMVDARIYVWEPAEDDWRPLTLSERRTLWGFRNAG